MTLGRWFRDYIYIPLGGSRAGWPRYLMALFTVWAVTGLWHGASWNFVLWGLFYGVLLLIEKLGLKKLLDRLHPVIANLYTIIMVIFGWVLFDTTSLGHAGSYILAMAGGSGALADQAGVYYLYTYLPIFLLGFGLAGPRLSRRFTRMKQHMNNPRRVFFTTSLMALFVVSIAYILNQSFSPSMYIGF